MTAPSIRRTAKWIAWVAGAAAASFLAIFAYALFVDIAFDQCGLTAEHARSKVIRELNRLQLPEQFLIGPTDQLGTCSYDFKFQTEDTCIDYVILSTWIHGVKLTFCPGCDDTCSGSYPSTPHNKTLQTDEPEALTVAGFAAR